MEPGSEAGPEAQHRPPAPPRGARLVSQGLCKLKLRVQELVGSPSDGSRMVNVESFLDRYKMQVILPDGNCFSLPEEDALAQYLLPKAQEVASVFNLLDKDLDGIHVLPQQTDAGGGQRRATAREEEAGKLVPCKTDSALPACLTSSLTFCPLNDRLVVPSELTLPKWQGNLDVNAHEIFESCFAAGAAFLEVVQFCRGWCQ
eukprot:762928-Hanusia_phi.AAC.2